jgi:hypothetical protein
METSVDNNPNPGKARGRPKGSSRYKELDQPLLRKIAEMMEADAALTKTAAIKRLIGNENNAGLHRLQEKFARYGEFHRSAIREAKHERDRQAFAAKLEECVLAWRGAEKLFAQAILSPKGQAMVQGAHALAFTVGGCLVGVRESMRHYLVDDFTRRVQETQRKLGPWGQIGR